MLDVAFCNVKQKRDIFLRYVLEQMFVWFLCNMTIKKTVQEHVGGWKYPARGLWESRQLPLLV